MPIYKIDVGGKETPALSSREKSSIITYASQAIDSIGPFTAEIRYCKKETTLCRSLDQVAVWVFQH